MKITALAGGVGASKLLRGLVEVMDPAELTVIVNTGDDIELHGLSISPDLDIVTYTLAGIVEEKTGWGIKDDTFTALEKLAAFGREDWFHLGDKDLATHIHRTAMLRSGATLSQVTDSIRRALGVKARILPMSDQPVRTMIHTETGPIHFQHYLVKERARLMVKGITFEGTETASPAPGVVEALEEADGIVLCPSNPLISIGPILAVEGIREALRGRRDSVAAICPIVDGQSLKGPSDRMLEQLGYEVSALEVAKLYKDIAATFVIDSTDEAQKFSIEALAMKVVVTNTVMKTLEDKTRLALETKELLQEARTRMAAQ